MGGHLTQVGRVRLLVAVVTARRRRHGAAVVVRRGGQRGPCVRRVGRVGNAGGHRSSRYAPSDRRSSRLKHGRGGRTDAGSRGSGGGAGTDLRRERPTCGTEVAGRAEV